MIRQKRKVSVLWVQGLVQGVGFRPFIYRIAKEMGIYGEVENRNDGVRIRAILTAEEKACLIRRIYREHPPVASIYRIEEVTDEGEAEGEMPEPVYTGFTITPSSSASDAITQISPDIAVCDACMRDRRLQPHRFRYPFINCTHCGPRFSIIRDLPYDRERTTMASFAMCPSCRKEYTSVGDRRFHAQPVACNQCGPFYYATYRQELLTDYSTLLSLTVQLLQAGEVIAAKGIGGYHLICDALNETAVTRLRTIKARETKPFAVMFRDMESLEKYVVSGEAERRCLCSWRRPIVLSERRRTLPGEVLPLASGIHPGLHTLGCMLPYMPLHFDWFERLATPALVMTSANRSERPIAIRPEEAEEQLGGTVSFILHHNREIHNRVDDSVVQVYAGRPRLLRRSRGYVPEPFFTRLPVEGILAFGAEKVATFALGKGDTILQSQYIGDLKNWETFRFYTGSLARFQQLFRFTPRQLVCDLHPDYLSSQEAQRMADDFHLPLLKVQHHHAHAAACMAEYGLSEPVLAVVWDGTGLGEDGKIWGGEFFVCEGSHYTRACHLEYVPLPGGDVASEQPWRMAVSYLTHYALPVPETLRQRIGAVKIEQLQTLIGRKHLCPSTSSAGRLFDAVSSLLGICDYSTRQAEAAVLLEQAATDTEKEPYPFLLPEGENLSMQFLFEHILEDQAREVPVEVISARFHATLARVITGKIVQLSRETGIRKVVVSGGCFQNKRLTEGVQRGMETAGLTVYIPSRIPCNDSGISVGQLAIAAGFRS